MGWQRDLTSALRQLPSTLVVGASLETSARALVPSSSVAVPLPGRSTYRSGALGVIHTQDADFTLYQGDVLATGPPQPGECPNTPEWTEPNTPAITPEGFCHWCSRIANEWVMCRARAAPVYRFVQDYGRHLNHCAIVSLSPVHHIGCTCGFDEAAAAALAEVVQSFAAKDKP
jgi:hypothetical protein